MAGELSLPLAIILELKESIANHDRQLENLRSRISAVELDTCAVRPQFDGIASSVEVLRHDLKRMKSRQGSQLQVLTTRIETLEVDYRRLVSETGQKKSESPVPDFRPSAVSTPIPTPTPPVAIIPIAKASELSPVSLLTSQKQPNSVELPLKEEKSLDGIISYLTRKHGGNVHEKGIVTVTSKSVFSLDDRTGPHNVINLTSDLRFVSKDAPNQWICWDFGKLRLIPTHYSIRTTWGDNNHLRSWIVESSLDAQAWIVIDRRANVAELDSDQVVASFLLLKAIECRYVRLTQTDKNTSMKDFLKITAFELFGDLIE
jgi:hypothetical protein